MSKLSMKILVVAGMLSLASTGFAQAHGGGHGGGYGGGHGGGYGDDHGGGYGGGHGGGYGDNNGGGHGSYDRYRTIRIERAVYGGHRRFCDATDAVADICDRQTSCSVRASNNLCGDPARGVDKVLTISYTCGRELRRVRVNEYSRIWLSCDRRR